MAPLGTNVLHTPQSGSSELKNKFHLNLVEIVCKIDKKLAFGLILALFGAKKGPKIRPTGAIFYTHLKVPTLCM